MIWFQNIERQNFLRSLQSVGMGYSFFCDISLQLIYLYFMIVHSTTFRNHSTTFKNTRAFPLSIQPDGMVNTHIKITCSFSIKISSRTSWFVFLDLKKDPKGYPNYTYPFFLNISCLYYQWVQHLKVLCETSNAKWC